MLKYIVAGSLIAAVVAAGLLYYFFFRPETTAPVSPTEQVAPPPTGSLLPEQTPAVDLADLFIEGMDYLTRLSQLTAAALAQSLGANYDADLVRRGTAPLAKNFSNLVLGEPGLIVTFSPGQVAPQAMGEQVITLPYTALTDILSPASILIISRRTPVILEQKIEESTAAYEIYAEFPEFAQLGATSTQEAATANARNFVEEKIGQFKTDVHAGDLRITFEQNRLDRKFVSGKFEYTSSADSAHEIYGFNYDFENEERIVLADLFQSDSDYLLYLSQISRDLLRAQLQDDYAPAVAEAGPEPQPGNFENFNVGAGDLWIFFRAGQVAPPSDGPAEIILPFADIMDLLDPAAPALQ